jgi:hypothetical protein
MFRLAVFVCCLTFVLSQTPVSTTTDECKTLEACVEPIKKAEEAAKKAHWTNCLQIAGCHATTKPPETAAEEAEHAAFKSCLAPINATMLSCVQKNFSFITEIKYRRRNHGGHHGGHREGHQEGSHGHGHGESHHNGNDHENTGTHGTHGPNEHTGSPRPNRQSGEHNEHGNKVEEFVKHGICSSNATALKLATCLMERPTEAPGAVNPMKACFSNEAQVKECFKQREAIKKAECICSNSTAVRSEIPTLMNCIKAAMPAPQPTSTTENPDKKHKHPENPFCEHRRKKHCSEESSSSSEEHHGGPGGHDGPGGHGGPGGHH